MPLIDSLIEKDILPDSVIRWGIRRLLRQRLDDERSESAAERRAKVDAFAAELRTLPVAIETKAANEQHYEVPAAFYKLCLGPRLKYSSCYYETGQETIGQAEETMLARTCARAELQDGLEILELGCGWGSLTLWRSNTRTPASPASRTPPPSGPTSKASAPSAASRTCGSSPAT
jgi:cyclopropane-fatty-acyl-phospholipid synthase